MKEFCHDNLLLHDSVIKNYYQARKEYRNVNVLMTINTIKELTYKSLSTNRYKCQHYNIGCLDL